MKIVKISCIALTFLVIEACRTTKNSTASDAPAATTTTATSTPPAKSNVTGPMPAPKSKDGIFAPGNEELLAMQMKYNDVTMEVLTQGYAIYTGVCTNCHAAKNIYNRPEERWAGIIDNMAPKSKLTPSEKDAVYKYVLAVKATQR